MPSLCTFCDTVHVELYERDRYLRSNPPSVVSREDKACLSSYTATTDSSCGRVCQAVQCSELLTDIQSDGGLLIARDQLSP